MIQDTDPSNQFGPHDPLDVVLDGLIIRGEEILADHPEYENGKTWIQRFPDGSMDFLREHEGNPDHRLGLITEVNGARYTIYEMHVGPDRTLSVDVKIDTGKEILAFRHRSDNGYEHPQLRAFLTVLSEGLETQ